MFSRGSIVAVLIIACGISPALKADSNNKCKNPKYVALPMPPTYVAPPDPCQSLIPNIGAPPIWQEPPVACGCEQECDCPPQACKLGVTGTLARIGLIVQGVESGSIAERAGVRPGDTLTKINHFRISDRLNLQRGMEHACHNGSIYMLVQRIDEFGNRIVIPLKTETTLDYEDSVEVVEDF